MRRLLLAAAAVLSLFVSTKPADAEWVLRQVPLVDYWYLEWDPSYDDGTFSRPTLPGVIVSAWVVVDIGGVWIALPGGSDD